MEITVIAEFKFEVDPDTPADIIERELYGREIDLDLRTTRLEYSFGAPEFVTGYIEEIEYDSF